MSKIDLSIIIVNWNSVDYLSECLSHIYKRTHNLTFEIIVVDNASYDGCREMLAAQFPEVKFIQSEKNLGFAGANNLAYKHASADTLLFLNPDTEVVNSAIDKMAVFLKNTSDAGAVGCKLLNPDQSVQLSSVKAFPTILNQMFDAERLKYRFPKLKLWGMQPLFDDSGIPVKVDVVSGACMMLKREVFENAGLFTTDYFMYGEDVDLCYKINKSGFHVYYFGDARVIHYEGKSASKQNNNFFSVLMMQNAKMIFFEKVRGLLYARIYKIMIFIVSCIRLFFIILLKPIKNKTLSSNNAEYSYKKWKAILKWSFGREQQG